jgi:hypothetical protein
VSGDDGKVRLGFRAVGRREGRGGPQLIHVQVQVLRKPRQQEAQGLLVFAGLGAHGDEQAVKQLDARVLVEDPRLDEPVILGQGVAM